jgi:hypothetical protein
VIDAVRIERQIDEASVTAKAAVTHIALSASPHRPATMVANASQLLTRPANLVRRNGHGARADAAVGHCGFFLPFVC